MVPSLHRSTHSGLCLLVIKPTDHLEGPMNATATHIKQAGTPHGERSGNSNKRVAVRIALAFAVVVTCLLASTIIGIWKVGTISDDLTTINDQNAVKQRYAINFRGSVHNRAIAVRDLVYAAQTEDDAFWKREKDYYDGQFEFYLDSDQKMDAIFAQPDLVTDQEIAELQAIKDVQTITNPLADEIIALTEAGDAEGALKVLLEEAKPQYDEWLRVINVFIDHMEASNQETTASARGTADSFTVLMLIALGVAALVAAAAAWWTIRDVLGAMRRAKEAQEIAAREQEAAVEAESKAALQRAGAEAESAQEAARRQQAALEEAETLKRKVDALLVTVDKAAAGDLTAEVTVFGDDPVGQMGEGIAKLLTDLRSSCLLYTSPSPRD